MEEIWKDIDGFEGLYKISSFGNVYSISKKKLMSLERTPANYKRVSLRKNGKNKHFQVHRLVAQAFIPNPHNLPLVNHKDENPSNNYVDNLEWCTQSYNLNYGTRNLKISANSRPVKQITFDGFVVAVYYSANFAGKIMGVNPSNIYSCLRGELPYAYDYKWEYV